MRAILIVLMLLSGTGLMLLSGTRMAGAVLPDEVLGDPVLETRARELSAGIRCMVCQNQSIDDSEAGLARDLRILVRERLVAGDSDEAVVQFLVDRYGEFILLEPRLYFRTWILWFAPGLLFLTGAGLMWQRSRRPGGTAPAGLTAAERKTLDEIMRHG